MVDRNLARMRERWNMLRRRSREMQERHAESQTMLGIAMAGIAALFILGIVAAYNYAATDDPLENLRAQVPTEVPSQAPPRPLPETTGSGGGERQAPPSKPAAR
jgi:hypothetical protein